MTVYLGADHGGFEQKAFLIAQLQLEGLTVEDCGTDSTASVDYPDFAERVAEQVLTDSSNFGILCCRSGEGMVMAANKIGGIRAALVWGELVAAETRRDNDANILVLPADFLSDSEALLATRRFLSTPFSQLERHIRRLQKLHQLESTTYVPTT